MLNDTMLQAFIDSFYGYGSFTAPYWFVGMEEGGGGSLEEISQRLEAWDIRGQRQLEDVAAYHRSIGITRHWDEPVKLQSTWNKLIHVLMSVKGMERSQQDIKDYQRDHLGRENDETCLIELMPLPSPGTSKWLYRDISSIPYLIDRQSYLEEVSSTRINHIRTLIASYKPSFVLFYGLGYMNYWQDIARNSLEQSKLEGVSCGRNNNTLFIAMKHPVAQGVTNEYFKQVGSLISSALADNL